jgi:hypothetical protein
VECSIIYRQLTIDYTYVVCLGDGVDVGLDTSSDNTHDRKRMREIAEEDNYIKCCICINDVTIIPLPSRRMPD